MVKPIAVAFISVAFASSDVLSDDALSLLQMRAQKHQVQQPFTLADGSVLEVRAGGTHCADDEIITFAKCVEAQKRQVIPNTMAHGTVYNQRGAGITPIGCFIQGGANIYFNDEPGTAKGWPNISPICQVGGGGGRAAEIIAQGISCQEPTCTQPPGPHKMQWDDSVFVPELKLGAAGSVCEEACGLLTYEQCEKATDMGLIDALLPAGILKLKQELGHQTVDGPSHTQGGIPSSCSIHTATTGASKVYFSSIDTPTGAFAAPGTAGDAWVTPSGVGRGWSYLMPICGVCTTTTTTTTTEAAAIESIIDEAAGECPDNQMVAYVEGRADNAEYRRDAQRKMVTFDTEDGAQGVCNVEDDCVGIWSDGKSWLGLYPGGRSWAKGVPNGSVKSVKLKSCVDIPVEEDEAAAVGDPHFVTNTGNRFDYS